jgi:alpha-glucosidase
MLKYLFVFVLGINTTFSKNWEVKSPKKQITASISFENGILTYSIQKGTDTLVFPSILDLHIKGYEGITWKLDSIELPTIKLEQWNSVWGANAKVNLGYTFFQLSFSNKVFGKKNVQWKISDRGVGFRTHLVGKDASKYEVLLLEKSQINLSKQGKCWWAWADYDTQEQTFHETGIQDATWVNTPFTIALNDSSFLAIHEAGLVNYSRMTLKRDSRGVFTTDLVPWKNGDLVRFKGEVTTPWRVILVESLAAGLIESEWLRTLNEPCKIKETSWIKPISYVGIWWEMHQGTHTWTEGPRHAATTSRAKEIIHFAAQNRIGGVLVEGWNTGWDRWGQDSVFDQTTSAKDYDLIEVAKYAKMKGVELIAHCETGGDAPFFEDRLDAAFSLYRKLGIRYVKTGYAGAARPIGEHLFGQGMIKHYQMVVEKAAKYELMLDVHECIQPTGLERTWPNLMTGESVRGMEWEAWSAGNSPDHTVLLPFTRGLAGPMDYTPGIADVLFKNRGVYQKWNGQGKDGMECRVHSTAVHQMALMGALYSPMQMAADRFENYQNSPTWQQFFRLFQTDVVTSKVLAAEVGKYFVVARKFKNGVWMVSAINGTQERSVEINWDFLGDGEKNSYVFSDLGDWQNQSDQIQVTAEPIKTPTEQVFLPAGGGKVWFLVPKGPKIQWD